LIEAAARALDLPIEPAWLPTIKANLEVTLRLGKGGASFPLPGEGGAASGFEGWLGADWGDTYRSAQARRGAGTSAGAPPEAALARIADGDGVLNSFTAVTRDRALAKAQAIDAAKARGEALGPLAGVPFAVKNLFDVAGLATLAGSKINREHAPAKSDSTLV